VGKPVVVVRELECAAGPAALWPFIADTERFNRSIGLRAIVHDPLSDAGAARYLVHTRLGGFPVEYEERPFEWIENRRFAVRRLMRGGALRSLEFCTELEPREGGGTRVRFQLVLEPRFAILRPLARLNGGRSLDAFVRVVEEVDAQLARAEPAMLPAARNEAQQDALTRAAAALRDALPEPARPLADRLAAHVRDAQDAELVRLRPYELADAWGVDRGLVLSLLLQGVVAGMLELSWELVCPSCRLGAAQVPSLAAVPQEGHCQLCDLHFGLDLDRAVEATFRPAAAVRAVDLGPYCIGGPLRTPHVVSQVVLPADGAAVLAAPEAPGRYRLFARGGATASVETQSGAPEAVDVSVGEQVEPGLIAVSPSGRVTVRLAAGGERHVKIERLDWADRAATAHQLSLSPTFRRLFSGQVLRAGLMLKVARVALLFSDLTASTALYRRAGDANAFKLVQDHFELLGAIAQRHGGAIVKTIGDAVMAAFADEAEAMRAAIEMQDSFHAFRAGHGDAADVYLKLGLFAGPCYVVTANGVLDYFGMTVNVAARLQATAEPGEIVVPEELAERARDAGWLGNAQLSARFEAELKGLDGAVKAARIVSAFSTGKMRAVPRLKGA